jgi:type II secretory pathway pseudopilin PulG
MNRRSTQGFTVIEIVLVLAIASLIFLLIFFALPALQRSSRDTQRTQAAQQAMALLDQFRTNTGRYPTTAADFVVFTSSYPFTFKDPLTGNAYQIEYSSALFSSHSVPIVDDKIFFTTGHWCTPGGLNMIDGDHLSQFVILVIVRKEIGGYYCIDNHGG